MTSKLFHILIILIVFHCILVFCHNKYSEEVNVLKKSQIDFRELDKPFRMAKLNMLWTKAKLRLTESKLKSIFSELKIHDREELTLKKIKSEGNDKEGMKEAEIRKKLIGIMSSYDLLEHFEDIHDNAKNSKYKSLYGQPTDAYHKGIFKDKKLNKLWEKAEKAGFTVQELKALREEFEHHQEKINTYQSIIMEDSHANEVNLNTLDMEKLNEIEDNPSKNLLNEKANLIREKHLEIRDGYDRLQTITSKGPKSKEFIEPKVQGLWKIALESNFTSEELESLRVELLHYENRLLNSEIFMLKLLSETRKKSNEPQENAILQDTLKKQIRKVEKLHTTLESKIMVKHAEL